MKKIIIFKKEELLDEVGKNLADNLNLRFGIEERIIENETIITDVIEIECDFIDDELEESLHNITDFYKYEENKIIIELTDLIKFINKQYGVEVTEIYDFFESNSFGDMSECISFELM